MCAGFALDAAIQTLKDEGSSDFALLFRRTAYPPAVAGSRSGGGSCLASSSLGRMIRACSGYGIANTGFVAIAGLLFGR
jgi:hypothetical protein